jgi:uncharacterized protein YyaL (SSP411 family)
MKENRLAAETSPYLLQHAHNPVDWYPWGEEAIEKAKAEDKPILVSIGYAACHWCHVMERESFEDVETAEIMNQYFINIKVDREERPDIDHIYMDAIQAMTGSGGWPLNIFLTPGLNPFYGGTYFPPVRAYNRMSWKETLMAVHQTFQQKRDDVEAQGNNMVKHLSKSNTFTVKDPAENISEEEILAVSTTLLKQADKEWGGFGNAPKFPHTFLIRYLLRDYYHSGNKAALEHAILSLDKLIYGGIYDQLAGGFARYSTDEKWLAPHFEKMLYDNALILEALSEAYQLTKFPRYKKAINETVSFVKSEMMSAEGGFYSAYDADSEGVEGKYYTWSKTEIEDILNSDAELFCRIFNVTESGNWEHTNILWLPEDPEMIIQKEGLPEEMFFSFIEKCKQKLLAVRQGRIKPQLDDKQLLNWNALMNTALSKVYAATGNQLALEMALSNISFVESKFYKQTNWNHTYKNGTSKIEAFLDDHAFLANAYLNLQDVTGDPVYLSKAYKIIEHAIDRFSDEDDIFFFYTESDRSDVIVRKKEVYDGALPSSNAVMADVLLKLGKLYDKRDWISRSAKMLFSLKKAILSYPSSFGYWTCTLSDLHYGVDEVAIVGKDSGNLLEQYLSFYHPNRILQSSEKEENSFPLLAGKPANNEARIYFCKDYSCKQPFTAINDLILLLKRVN